jgi:hypothetical protein
MAPRCYQSFNNGQRCNAPAIHGSKFCRHHDQQRTVKSDKEKSGDMEPLILPLLLDKRSVLAALNLVLQALGEGRIKRSVADTLLSGIRMANRLLTEIAEAGESALPAMAAAQSLQVRRQPEQPSTSDVYKPSERDVEQFMHTLRQGGAQQLTDHVAAKIAASAGGNSADGARA